MEIVIEKIPGLVKEEINKIDPDSEVILFGSRARGDFDDDSDWDFLILLSKPIDPETEDVIRNSIYEIELEFDEIITSIIEEKSEWERYEESLIYKNIEEQGIPIRITD